VEIENMQEQEGKPMLEKLAFSVSCGGTVSRFVLEGERAAFNGPGNARYMF
jgi:hypothetical protein